MRHIHRSSAVLLLGCAWALLVATSDASDPRRCLGRMATIVGTESADEIRGTRGADTIVGLGGADQIAGRGGSDRICGGGDSDSLLGGSGSDLVSGGTGADRIGLGPGRDGANGGHAGDEVSGARGNDSLFGGKGPDVLRGGPGGRDFHLAGGGGDTVDGGDGLDDTISYLFADGEVAVRLDARATGGDGVDELSDLENVRGSQFNDRLTGNSARNLLAGNKGADELLGGEGSDSLVGSRGPDMLNGGGGADWAIYMDASSGIEADLRASTVIQGDDTDALIETENVEGSLFDDLINGSLVSNVLLGRSGSDRLFGHEDNDVLYGEAGADEVDGGLGDDTCDRADSSVGCETLVLVEPKPGSAIAIPRHGRVIERDPPLQLHGYVSESPFAEVNEMRIALWRLGRAGCRAWHPPRKALLPRACTRPDWFTPEVNERKGRWSYAIQSSLPEGYYVLRSLLLTSRNEGGQITRERPTVPGINLSEFRLR